jgi:uncharacterized protein (DUF362 family)
LGGIRSFIKSGDRVLLKPNQAQWLPQRTGSTTSPRLIRTLIRLCFEAGAREVWVAEASGHAQSSRQVMSNTGMAHGVAATGAHLIYLEEIAQKVFDFGEETGELRFMPAPEIMERADVIINVPKAKTHFVDPISCACKNWVGIIPMAFRLWLQKQGATYYQATALFLRRFKPALNIVDGAWAGEGQGPGANDPFWWGWLLASTDAVALDVTLARLFELDFSQIRMANEAALLGLGQTDPAMIELVGATFEQARRKVRKAETGVHRYPCNVIVGEGITIEGTLGHWKIIADTWKDKGLWGLFTLRGRPTFMFGKAEDPDFERHLKEGPYVVLDDAAADRYKYDPRVTFVPGSPVPQSYIQHEMIEGMGFGWVYRTGLSIEELIEKVGGIIRSRG